MQLADYADLPLDDIQAKCYCLIWRVFSIHSYFKYFSNLLMYIEISINDLLSNEQKVNLLWIGGALVSFSHELF